MVLLGYDFAWDWIGDDWMRWVRGGLWRLDGEGIRVCCCWGGKVRELDSLKKGSEKVSE